MVEVKLQFPSIDAAIVALGKMAVGGQVREQRNDKATESSVPPAAAASEKKTRKPRADAGQKREPYGPRTTEAAGASATTGSVEAAGNGQTAAPDAGKAAEKAADPTSTTADAPKAETKPAATNAPTASHDDAQKALEKVFKTKGLSDAQDLLALHGCKRLRDLAPERYGQFIVDAETALAAT